MFLSMPYRQRLLMIPPYLLGFIYALLATYGVFSGGVWASAVIGGALIISLCVGFGQQRMIVPPKCVILLGAGGIVAAALSSFQAIHPDKAWHETLKIVTIFLPLSFLFAPQLRPYIRWGSARLDKWAVLFGFSALLMVVGLSVSYNLWGYSDRITTLFNRGFSYNLLLFWPLVAFLFLKGGRSKLIWILSAIILLSLCFTHSRASQLGMVVALFVFAGIKIWPAFFRWIVGFVTLAFFVFPWCVPFLYSHYTHYINKLPESWRHRMEIWDSLSYYFADSIFFGPGIGNTGHLAVIGPNVERYQQMEVVASHPHNAAVQLWVEMGAVGVSFGIFTCFLALRAIQRLSRDVQPFAYAAYSFALIITMVAYNLWTDSLWSAYALTAFSFSALFSEKA